LKGKQLMALNISNEQNQKTKRVYRNIIFSTISLNGFYRYKDVFQITPLGNEHPKPKGGYGHFPVLLEYTCETNRNCKNKLLDMSFYNDPIPKHLKELFVDSSILEGSLKEILMLLTFFTTSVFFVYKNSFYKQSWFVPLSGQKQSEQCLLGHMFYLPNKIDLSPQYDFSLPTISLIPQMDTSKYLNQHYSFPGQGDSCGFYLPDTIDTMFDNYYNLKNEAKSAFKNAIALFYMAVKIWDESKSLAFAALISCLEAIIKYEYKDMDKELEPCPTCKTTQYRVMKKFRMFLNVDNLPNTDPAKSIIKRLYNFRSEILHQGGIFTTDIGEPGYQTKNKIDQEGNLSAAFYVSRARLIDWLHRGA